MKFRIKRATNLFKKETPKPCENAIQDGDKWYVELNTLEDLIKFRDEVSEDLIIEYGWEDNPILIYDTYIEEVRTPKRRLKLRKEKIDEI